MLTQTENNIIKKVPKINVCNKLSSQLMKKGKKGPVLKLIHDTLNGSTGVKMITCLIYKLKPSLETRQIRKGSKFFDVPFFLKKKRSILLALRWFTKAIKARKDRSLNRKILVEIEDLVNKTGQSYKSALTLRKKVSKNIFYGHFRW